MFKNAIAVSSLAAVLFTSASFAQQPQSIRIRGTIEKVDGNVLTVKAREGDEKIIKVPDDVRVTGIQKIAMSEIKPGSYIGVSGMPKADGKQQALAIHIFPEAQRGTNEGFQPWDLKPGSNMTNATVADRVTGTSGESITVKYKGGEKTVEVPQDTPIVAFVPGDKAELKPGAKVIVFGAVQGADGKYDASRLGVGRDGIVPPM